MYYGVPEHISMSKQQEYIGKVSEKNKKNFKKYEWRFVHSPTFCQCMHSKEEKTKNCTSTEGILKTCMSSSLMKMPGPDSGVFSICLYWMNWHPSAAEWGAKQSTPYQVPFSIFLLLISGPPLPLIRYSLTVL